MSESTPERKVGDLFWDAKASLASLLKWENLNADQSFMRLSSGGVVHNWEVLTRVSTEEADRAIRTRIAQNMPVTDLVLAYIGLVSWRGTKSLMAHMQYFRSGYENGLLFGSHLTVDAQNKSWQVSGGFLIMGACKNIWV
jgi:hypothetical protein